jgi:hypothetical protein
MAVSSLIVLAAMSGRCRLSTWSAVIAYMLFLFVNSGGLSHLKSTLSS